MLLYAWQVIPVGVLADRWQIALADKVRGKRDVFFHSFQFRCGRNDTFVMSMQRDREVLLARGFLNSYFSGSFIQGLQVAKSSVFIYTDLIWRAVVFVAVNGFARMGEDTVNVLEVHR